MPVNNAAASVIIFPVYFPRITIAVATDTRETARAINDNAILSVTFANALLTTLATAQTAIIETKATPRPSNNDSVSLFCRFSFFIKAFQSPNPAPSDLI